jgi:hypothetical protein
LSLAEKLAINVAGSVVTIGGPGEATVQVGQLNEIRSKSGAQLPTIGL